jgi:Uma2 family endonuclease
MVTATQPNLIPEAFREIVLQRPLDADDLRSFPDDRNRYEIIGGQLIVSPSPSTRHQHVLIKLASALDVYLSTEGAGQAFIAPLNVRLSCYDVVQPDLLVVLDDRKEIIQEQGIVGAPNLVVEILSPSSNVTDFLRKSRLYEQYGVKEFWIVNPDSKIVSAQALDGDRYHLVGEYSRNDKLYSAVLEGFEPDVSVIFADTQDKSAQKLAEETATEEAE